MGMMSDDGNFSAVPPMLAELIDLPHTTAAVKLEKADGSLSIEREVEGGTREVVERQAPCVIAVQTGMNQIRYASLKGIMAAKKKPLDAKTAADLGVAGQVGASSAKVKIESLSLPPKGEGAEILQGSNEEVAGVLAGKIKELGLL
jgi:electron transfer flavoprotein beta subunit